MIDTGAEQVGGRGPRVVAGIVLFHGTAGARAGVAAHDQDLAGGHAHGCVETPRPGHGSGRCPGVGGRIIKGGSGQAADDPPSGGQHFPIQKHGRRMVAARSAGKRTSSGPGIGRWVIKFGAGILARESAAASGRQDFVVSEQRSGMATTNYERIGRAAPSVADWIINLRRF